MKGQFTAVVHGEFSTGSRFPALILAACAGIVALVSLVTEFLIPVLIAAGGFALAFVAVCVAVRRHNDRDMQLMAERTSVPVAPPARAIPGGPREVHYHLYLPPGADASGVNWAAALPPGDAPTSKED